MKKPRSRIPDIFRQIAPEFNAEIHISSVDPDSGYILFAGKERRFFTYGSLDINTCASAESAINKAWMSDIAKSLGLITPQELVLNPFKDRSLAQIIKTATSFVENVKLPVFVKPLDGAQGNDIFKVCKLSNLKNVISMVSKKGKRSVILQEFTTANEVRIVYLDGQILQCYVRDYAHILGDGKLSIKSLINKKNEYFLKRGRNTVINPNNNQLRNILNDKGYTLNSILKPKERLDISYGRNLSQGGECQHVRLDTSSPLYRIVSSFSKATNLRYYGLDLFIKKDLAQISTPDDLVFIEINASPGMENNFYYDEGYEDELISIYRKIFNSMAIGQSIL